MCVRSTKQQHHIHTHTTHPHTHPRKCSYTRTHAYKNTDMMIQAVCVHTQIHTFTHAHIHTPHTLHTPNTRISDHTPLYAPQNTTLSAPQRSPHHAIKRLSNNTHTHKPTHHRHTHNHRHTNKHKHTHTNTHTNTHTHTQKKEQPSPPVSGLEEPLPSTPPPQTPGTSVCIFDTLVVGSQLSHKPLTPTHVVNSCVFVCGVCVCVCCGVW